MTPAQITTLSYLREEHGKWLTKLRNEINHVLNSSEEASREVALMMIEHHMEELELLNNDWLN